MDRRRRMMLGSKYAKQDLGSVHPLQLPDEAFEGKGMLDLSSKLFEVEDQKPYINKQQRMNPSAR